MGVICKYKYDSSIYADFIPEFNSGYSGYVITDEVEGNIITRTIESDELPTLMRFGRVYVEGESTTDNRTDSLLEVLDMNTSGLTDCDSMFRYNRNLTSITCEWNTSNVTNMYSMFSNCFKLTSLDVSNFDTSNVTAMNSMFQYCNLLTSLDVSNWDTNKVTNTTYMFWDCFNLTSLDVSNWDTSKVTNTNHMFVRCKSLTSLDVSNWDTSKVTNMDSMFWECSSLTTLDISNFNISNVTNMNNMFYNCYNLTTLDISNFNTSNVTKMDYMFYNTNSLEVISMFNSDINTINTIGNLTSATIYVDESLDQSQYTGTAPLKVYKEEKLEIKLNSPLLEGDTIEVVDGKICHVHRWEKVVFDGSQEFDGFSADHNGTHAFCGFGVLNGIESNERCTIICESLKPIKGFAYDYWESMIYMYYSDTYATKTRIYIHAPKNELISLDRIGFSKWLSENPVIAIYQLAEPYYEDITPLQSSIILKTFLESSITIDTNLPIETKLSYRTNVPSISTLSTRATELAESDNVIHNLMNIIDDEVDE